jgi:hypothetical protein
LQILLESRGFGKKRTGGEGGDDDEGMDFHGVEGKDASVAHVM